MQRLLLIGFGSGLGGIARYLMSTSIAKLIPYSFPWGTLAVNALGSFLIGFLFIALMMQLNEWHQQLRAVLMIGFLGGFTTFSAFSLETINLIEQGKLGLSIVNIILSVIVCLALTWIGILLARGI